MITYYQNGTSQDEDMILDAVDYFYIQHTVINGYENFFYPKDEIYISLQNELVILYDKLRDLYFSDIDLYYKVAKIVPIGIAKGGQDSDIFISKDDFIKLKNEFDKFIPSINQHLYVGDCQYLVSTVQNLLEAVEYCYINYFISLAQIDLFIDYSGKTDEYCISSNKSRQLSFLLETYFTKAYSVLDILCKIVYELENPVSKSDFHKYLKLKSTEKLWGDRKKLKINCTKDTVFEECNAIKIIESLRNEAVHNGSWEIHPRMYCKVKDGIIKERYMLFPDFAQGRLDSINNRKHFFSNGTKVNDILPEVHIEYLTRLLQTVKYLNSVAYDKEQFV